MLKSTLISHRTVLVNLAIGLLCAAAVPVSAQTTYYVNGACGSNAWTGTSAVCSSPNGPKRRIQAGINVSSTGDTVIVADGIYTGTGNRDLDFGGRDIHLRSESRDPALCIIDCQGSAADPHRGFIFQSGETLAATLEGFTIRNGYANVGGAIRCLLGSATIIGCIMTDNVTSASSGGFACQDANAVLIDCIIRRNTSGPNGGGGILAANGTLTLIGCEISENRELGGTNNGGGGVLVATSATILEMVGCTVRDNDTDGRGGGLLCQGVGTVSDTRFLGNRAGIGGGAWVQNPGTLFVDCQFENNTAETFGGGLYARNAEVVNCVISGNSATLGGGGIYAQGHRATFVNCVITGNTTPGEGGGALCHSAMSLANCTIYGNTAARGGGVAAQGNCGTELFVSNTVVWNNTAPVGPELAVVNGEFGEAATLNVSYTDAQGGVADVFVDTNGTLNWGPGNINADPLFVDPDGPDNDPNTFDDNDYSLSAGSPCIDAGDNTAVPADVADLDDDGDLNEPTPLDLAGDERFVNDPDTTDTGVIDPNDPGRPNVDMGAYEFQSCLGDITGDNQVDLEDLVILLSNYATPSGATYEDGDLTGDGDVDLEDLAIMLSAFGTICT